MKVHRKSIKKRPKALKTTETSKTSPASPLVQEGDIVKAQGALVVGVQRLFSALERPKRAP